MQALVDGTSYHWVANVAVDVAEPSQAPRATNQRTLPRDISSQDVSHHWPFRGTHILKHRAPGGFTPPLPPQAG